MYITNIEIFTKISSYGVIFEADYGTVDFKKIEVECKNYCSLPMDQISKHFSILSYAHHSI